MGLHHRAAERRVVRSLHLEILVEKLTMCRYLLSGTVDTATTDLLIYLRLHNYERLVMFSRLTVSIIDELKRRRASRRR